MLLELLITLTSNFGYMNQTVHLILIDKNMSLEIFNRLNNFIFEIRLIIISFVLGKYL